MITKPTLPPKQGYVEDVDLEGNHYYKQTAETQRQLELETANARLQAQIQAQSATMDFHEDCVAEMAETVYAE